MWGDPSEKSKTEQQVAEVAKENTYGLRRPRNWECGRVG